ncbi:hypothetical protein Ga0100231_012425 [Opitutaceae bacterium TAV4]|nr:hypothetical protein Ga0100231_012425 [Opitutaceae bacterium TAV4]RRJ98870.1 hypothetical protein Ga0100230_011210 [Opitutaceae bacterium TAV3]
MNTTKLLLLTFLALSCFSGKVLPLTAADNTLVKYSFVGNDLVSILAPDASWAPGLQQPSNITDPASIFSRSPSGGSGNSVNLVTNLNLLFGKSAKDAQSALNSGTFVEFTLRPQDNATMTLNSFSAWVGVYSNIASNSAFDGTFFLCSSLTGYTESGILATTSLSITQNGIGGATTGSLNFNLGPAFENLSQSVTFRIYVYGVRPAFPNTGNAGQILRIDDIMVTGSVSAIPEPAAVAVFVGIAAFAGAWLLRHRRQF